MDQICHCMTTLIRSVTHRLKLGHCNGQRGLHCCFFGEKKSQGYETKVKAFSQAKVTSTFKWTATSESLKCILSNPPSYGSIGGSSKISIIPKYFCLLGKNILMLPSTIQDSDLIYKFIVKLCNISLLGEGNARVLNGAKVFGQGSLSKLLITALSLNDTGSHKSFMGLQDTLWPFHTKGFFPS